MHYPIEDSVIHAYNITEEEMLPYMNDSRQWTEIFRDIMSSRENIKSDEKEVNC